MRKVFQKELCAIFAMCPTRQFAVLSRAPSERFFVDFMGRIMKVGC